MVEHSPQILASEERATATIISRPALNKVGLVGSCQSGGGGGGKPDSAGCCCKVTRRLKSKKLSWSELDNYRSDGSRQLRKEGILLDNGTPEPDNNCSDNS